MEAPPISAFVECFKHQIGSLTEHPIETEKESFSRIGNVLLRNYLLYTNVFHTQIKKRFGSEQKVVEKFLKKVKSGICSVFREALLPMEEEFSISRFACRLQLKLTKYIETLKLSGCNWCVLHSFQIEPSGNGLLEVFAGFAFDAEPSNLNEIPIFNFKISNLELQSEVIDSTGKTHTDLLHLDTVKELEQFTNPKMTTQA
ncbi:MAG: hypothetical protein ACE5R6_15655 [Candidatus Heimdallarchaeota archaeon]